MSVFSINTFLAQLEKGNFAKKSNFQVLISGPEKLGLRQDELDMTFRCDSIDEPGRNITISTDSYYYGLPLARAYGSTFQEVTLGLILSEDEREKIYFEKWQDLMIGDYRSGVVNQNMFDIGYLNDYLGTVTIYRYDDTGYLRYTTVLKNAFPTLVSDTSLEWSTNDMIRLSVRMYFQYYVDYKQ